MANYTVSYLDEDGNVVREEERMANKTLDELRAEVFEFSNNTKDVLEFAVVAQYYQELNEQVSGPYEHEDAYNRMSEYYKSEQGKEQQVEVEGYGI